MSQVLKYGENAWQTPAEFVENPPEAEDALAIGKFQLVGGSGLSYNNLCDLDRLLQTITHIAAGLDRNDVGVPAIAVGCKHGNACGAGFGRGSAQALTRMLKGDKRAIMGGWVITNVAIREEQADILLHHGLSVGERRLLDGIAAPMFTSEAIELLARKKGKCRLVENPALSDLTASSLDTATRFRYVRGGKLTQPNYTYVVNLVDLVPDRALRLDLVLAWAVGSTSNSNTITLVRDGMLIGNGAGQQDRVSACELAIKRASSAGHNVEGAVAYSDSFFPFSDGPEELASAQVRAILSSSGSINDRDVIKACEDAGLNLILIADELGRGFFGH